MSACLRASISSHMPEFSLISFVYPFLSMSRLYNYFPGLILQGLEAKLPTRSFVVNFPNLLSICSGIAFGHIFTGQEILHNTGFAAGAVGCLWIPGSVQGHVGQGLEQPGIVEGVPALAGSGMKWAVRSLPNQTIP